jgi:hypothetical protein
MSAGVFPMDLLLVQVYLPVPMWVRCIIILDFHCIAGSHIPAGKGGRIRRIAAYFKYRIIRRRGISLGDSTLSVLGIYIFPQQFSM